MIRAEDVVAVPVLPSTMKAANKLGTFAPNAKSYMGGDRQLDGAIGEVVVKQYLEELGYPTVFSATEDYDCDLIMTSGERKIRVDVKTKRRDTWHVHQMVSSFEGSVQASSLQEIADKNVDVYIFVNLAYDKESNDYECAYIMGGMSKTRFLERAIQKRVGDHDPSNDLTSIADNFNIFYRELNQIT